MSTLSEQLADAVRDARSIPREMAEKLLIDVAGLCVAARNTDYVSAALAGWEASGGCTAIGHSRTLDAAGAPLLNRATVPRGVVDQNLLGRARQAPRPRGTARLVRSARS